MARRISVIVPCYNAAHVLPRTVPAMLAQTERAEWYFVDDGSTDATAQVLEELVGGHDASYLIPHDANRGRAAARNTGIEQARGELIVFLDADAKPERGFLNQLKAAIDQEGAVAVRGRLQMAGESGPLDAFSRYIRSERRGPSNEMAFKPTPWKYFLAGASCVHADVLDEVGGFNEEISYGEDLELAARISRRYPQGLCYSPKAVVELHDTGSLDDALARMVEFGRDNLPQMVADYPELARWTGVDVVHSAAPIRLRRVAKRLLLNSGAATLARALIPRLSAGLSDHAVRYLLGYTLATSYREGLNKINRR